LCAWCYVYASFVKTYDEAQDSTLGAKKRKIEEVTEVVESKTKKAKLADSASGTSLVNMNMIYIYLCGFCVKL